MIGFDNSNKNNVKWIIYMMCGHLKKPDNFSRPRALDVGGQHKNLILYPDYECWTLAGNIKTHI